MKSPKLVKDWMIGKYTLEQIHEQISQKTGIPYKFILETFKEECKNLDVSELLLKKIKTLKERYYPILITDNMDSFNRYTVPANPLLRETFEEISNSYNLGILKTTDNGRCFSDICTRLKIPIKNSILIDDSHNVCALFTKLGGTAYCVSGIKNVKKILEKID